MKTILYLIRHGQPEIQNALLGSTDSPLTQTGWSQLEQLTKQLNNIDCLISSPLSRCAVFAQQYADNNKQKLIINTDFSECDFGDWDGMSFKFLYEQFPQAMDRFYNDPVNNMPPASEDLIGFSKRVESALLQLIKKHSGKQIAIFTHAGVIRTLVAWCLKIDYSSGLQFQRIAIDYASMTEISIYSEKNKLYPQLVRLNNL